MPRFHSGAATDRPETTKMILSPNLQVEWHQRLETNLEKIHKDLNIETHKKTHALVLQQSNIVELQTSPVKGNSSQNVASDTESLLENQSRNAPVQCLKDSQEQQLEIQENDADMAANDSRDIKISPPRIYTSQIAETC